MKTLLCTLILATLGATAAQADTITITFDQPNQVALPGTTVEFFGTLTNNTTGTIFLNGDALNIAGLSFTTTDQFFNNVPSSLAPGANSGDIELFDISASSPLLDAAGFYTGTYSLLGGIDGNGQDVLETNPAAFSVDTAPATSPVPEPASIALFLTGASTLLPIAQKARKRLGKTA
jgi:hypothetical protein